MSNINIEELYRDSIATVDASGKRIWVYPKKPSGHYHRYRVYVSIVLLALFFGMPFIEVDGHPFMMFNIFERTFILFGQVFFPQDFVMFALGMIIFFVFVILFTVAFGRIWCGWACPQTVFMEMVFRKIEYWIEGDRNQQRKLAEMPWNAEKLLKKTSKYSIFLLISLLIAHTAMAYLIGLKEVIAIVQQPPSAHWAGFIGLMAFTAVFFFVFAYLREQACIAVCPYGRLQGVLQGKNTAAVIYDFLRGEPRGKIKKASNDAQPELPKGDCIDCHLCVQVCPTGIDIRNGSQMECVNCTACIDACDEVMDKVGKPKGLVRYGSQENVEKGLPFKINSRILAYSAVLLVLILAEAVLLFNRSEVSLTLMRVPGQLYQEPREGIVSNLYNAQLVNKTFKDMHIRLQVAEGTGSIRLIGQENKDIVLAKGAKKELVFFVDIPKGHFYKSKNSIRIEVLQGEKVIETRSSNFMAPQF